MIYYDLFYCPEHLTREEMYKKYKGKTLLVNNVKKTDSNRIISADVVVAERFDLHNFQHVFTSEEERDIREGDNRWPTEVVLKKAVYRFCLINNAVGYAAYMYNRMNEHAKRHAETIGKMAERYRFPREWENIKFQMDMDKRVEWNYLLSNIQAEYIVTITNDEFDTAFHFDDVREKIYQMLHEVGRSERIAARVKMEQEEFSDRTGAVLVNSMKNLSDYLQSLCLGIDSYAAYAVEKAVGALAHCWWDGAEKYIKEFLEHKEDIHDVKDITANYYLNRLAGFHFNVLREFYNRCMQYTYKNIVDDFIAFESIPIKNDVDGQSSEELIKRWVW